MKRNLILITGILAAVLIIGLAFMNYSVDDLLAQNQTAGRIAYVDIVEVYEIHPEKKEAEQKLGKMAQEMESSLKEQSGELSEEKQQEILQDYQQELSAQEEEMIQSILDNINSIIEKVAQDKEVKVVMEKQNIIYGGYDLTGAVKSYVKNNTEEISSEVEIPETN